MAVMVAPGATAIGAALPFSVRDVDVVGAGDGVGVSVGAGVGVGVGVRVGAVTVPTVMGELVAKSVRESLANRRASYVPAGVLEGIV